MSQTQADSSQEEAAEACKEIKTLVRSDQFKVVVAFVILLSTLVMAFQADYPIWHYPPGCTEGSCFDVWFCVNTALLMFFLVELTLRFITEGCIGFFRHRLEWHWNSFDFTIVVLGCMDFLVTLASTEQHAHNYTVMRSVRLLRITRVLRLFKQLKGLQILVKGLVSSFNFVFWILVMVVVLIFVSAIFCTMIIGGNAESWGSKADDITDYWGGVLRSMFTLFQILTLDDWNAITHLVYEQLPWMRVFFMAYVIFAAMVILSLLTGVMAEHIKQVAEEEDDSDKSAAERESSEVLNPLLEVFAEADVNDDKQLDKTEFVTLFKDKELLEKLKDIGIPLQEQEATQLFQVMDRNQDGFVGWDLFMRGMLEIRAEKVTNKQVFKLKSATNRALRKIQQEGGVTSIKHDFNSPSLTCEALAAKVEQRLTALETQMEKFTFDVNEVVQIYTDKFAEKKKRSLS